MGILACFFAWPYDMACQSLCEERIAIFQALHYALGRITATPSFHFVTVLAVFQHQEST
jgi:hypothetical protein